MSFSVIFQLSLNFILIFYNARYITTTSSSDSICFIELGCFNITNDFKHITYRPFNLLPESPKSINTKFLLYTRLNENNAQLVNLNDESNIIKSTNFNGNKETKFIIHGFIDNKEIGKWLSQMKDELLSNGDYNVFLVDWSEGNGMPYAEATANSRVVGVQLSLLIKNLNKIMNLKYRDCHIIGHSLGAHIAGYAGEKFSDEKIGRITGLDPAEPYFQYMPKTVRLDRTDAEFVDVIHTDSKSILQFGLGMSQAIGHIDFYPNSGKEQPGCSENRFSSFMTDGLLEGTRHFVACNHQRAVDYFIDSINGFNKCQFISYGCTNWSSFSTGCGRHGFHCDKDGSYCAYLGYYSELWKGFKNNSKSRKFYLKTNNKSPFCALQYKVEIKVDVKSNPFFGTMSLKFKPNTNFIYFNHNAQDILPEKTYVSVIVLPNNLSSVDSIEFKWSQEIDVFQPKTWKLNFFSDSIANKTRNEILFIKQISVKSLQTNTSDKGMKFCNPTSLGISPKKVFQFTKTCH